MSNVKRNIFLTAIILVLITGGLFGLYKNNFFQNENSNEVVNESGLKKSEIEGLLEMHEEEKMARDIYLNLYNYWSLEIFLTISKSEQAHMDLMKTLLVTHEIEDPIPSNEVGVFSNSKFLNIYENLSAQGIVNLEQAFRIVTTLEEMDIYDLENAMTKTDSRDLRSAYSSLSLGSKKHLRIFVEELKIRGFTYEPQYLTPEEFKKAIAY